MLGEPINFGKIENPNYDEIGAAHGKYMEKLQVLFDQYKHLYLDSETVLEICWNKKFYRIFLLSIGSISVERVENITIPGKLFFAIQVTNE